MLFNKNNKAMFSDNLSCDITNKEFLHRSYISISCLFGFLFQGVVPEFNEVYKDIDINEVNSAPRAFSDKFRIKREALMNRGITSFTK